MLDRMRAAFARLAAILGILAASIAGLVLTFGPVCDVMLEAGVPEVFVAAVYLGIMLLGVGLAVKKIMSST